MTLSDLTVSFEHQDRAALFSDWQWLVGEHMRPLLLCASGDAFLYNTQHRTVHFLDVAAGSLKDVAESVDAFQRLLTDKAFVVDHFAVQLVGDLRDAGVALKPGQIYSFKHPPVLGGEWLLSNFEATDIAVHFSVAGQLHRQVAALPDGTQITGVEFRRE